MYFKIWEIERVIENISEQIAILSLEFVAVTKLNWFIQWKDYLII